MEREKNEVFSKVVRAGKRTYFFDVKSTRSNDLYITLTESKKTGPEGQEQYEKHKIFLYKEDFDKFQEGLSEAIEKIKEIKNIEESSSYSESLEEVTFDEL